MGALGTINKRLNVTPWKDTVTFQATWESFAGYDVKYRLFQGMVQLRGMVSKTGAGPNCSDIAFTLPVGYRPTTHTPRIMAAPASTLGGATMVDIDTLGRVFIYEMGVAAAAPMTNSNFSLDSIQFNIN